MTDTQPQPTAVGDGTPDTQPGNKKPLGRRMRRFADEYLTGVSGAEAVRRLGWKPKPNPDGSKPSAKEASNQAAKIAYKYLRVPAVAEYIRERRTDLEESTGIRQERILRRLNLISESNPKDLHTEDGKPIPIQDMPEEVAASIQEIEYEAVEVKDADGKMRTERVLKKIKQHSPTQAAEQIARQLGWNKDSLELKAQLKVAALPPVIQLVPYDDDEPDGPEAPDQPPAK